MRFAVNHLWLKILAAFLMLWLVLGCTGGGEKQEVTAKVAVSQENLPTGALSDVPAELGGAGFTGEGWKTNTNYEPSGDPRAVSGGSVIWAISEFPATLRTIGKDSNSQFIFMVDNMIYESLLDIHPTTLEFIPKLATHWKISDDFMTFWFRINPDARFADGSRVTAEDVIASWKLRIDENILAPYTNIIWGKFEEPVAESPYIVRVHAKELNWKFFLYFGGMSILPAKYIGNLSGADYMKVYQFEMMPGSGPYRLDKNDIAKGRSLALTRRHDWWQENNPKLKGKYNFDRMKFIVVDEERLHFEKFKKGELDVYLMGRAQWWVEETDFDNIKRGLVQKRKIWNDNPQGVSGFVFNMREEPFNDLRMRQVFTYLLDRDKLISQLFFNEYIPMDSYYSGSVYENPDNTKYRYDPDKAVELLRECGWTKRNQEGWLVNDKGEILELTLSFGARSLERIFTVYQEDLQKVGIKLNLKQSQETTLFTMVNERKFKFHFQSWTGLLFPNPENDVSSWTADPLNTNNLAGLKDERIDELIKEYNICFDQARRIELVREIDYRTMQIQPYALAWYAPFQRVLYWNRFGHPESYLPRTEDWLSILTYWWIDGERDKKLEAAKKDNSIQLDVGETEVHYWEEYNKQHGRGYTLES